MLVALLTAQGYGQLPASEQSEAQAAITLSDNQSVLALFRRLEQLRGGVVGASGAIQSLFRISGDPRTLVATAPPPQGAVTTFGQTEWSPSASVKFFEALGAGCLLPPAQSGYVLGLMENIEPSESWGLGSAGFGARVAFKGGWGPEISGGYVVRQSGIIAPGSSRGTAVSIVTHAQSFGAGTQMVTAVAQWLAHEVVLKARGAPHCVPPS